MLAVVHTKICIRCRACKPVDQFHRGQSSCATCKNAAERSSRAARRSDPDNIRRIAANNRRRNLRRQMYRRPRLVESFSNAAYSSSLEEYADYFEHRSLGWCRLSGWRKQLKLTPKHRIDRNCKQCGFHSGTTLYCSPRCRYRWNYRNVPSFRAAEQARSMRRKSNPCEAVAAVLRRLFYGGKGGKLLPGLIGCDATTFVSHMIEQMPADMQVTDLLKPSMHIDHIVERRRFDLNDRDEWRRCWHYTNLRPMWSGDNLRRSRK